MVAARLMGGSADGLLTVTDPVQRLVERLVVGRAFERWEKVQEARIHMLANEVARRFGG